MASLDERLHQILPKERIKNRLIDCLAFSSDAGFYRLIPKAVVQPVDESEIQALFCLSRELNIPLTFRAGGTSLSGQSVSDGLLVDLSQHWRKISPLDQGKLVHVQPGAIGSWVNISLKPHGRKIGPDPSSIAAAMMGGILANNASGMCCGVHANSYHTLHSIRFLLPSGAAFDTSLPEEYARFEQEEASLFAILQRLKRQIRQSATLSEKIRTKYLLKNTVGYSLNAFLDYEHPLDILAHLLIGSEGTLAFISEAVLQTLPDLPYKATSLLIFPSIEEACHAIPILKNCQAEAVELMDRASLRSVESKEGLPSELRSLPEKSAALLVEFQSGTAQGLDTLLSEALPLLQKMPTLFPVEFTLDAAHQAKLWKIRKGLFPAVGAVRQQGSTVILEDIAFPVEQLAAAITDLQVLFAQYAYQNAIIFGHAKDGNLHFVVTQLFDKETEIKRYERFMEDLVHLVVVKYKGSLKAEHGTGRNMAPFVETEWGPEAYAIMEEVKKAIDPSFLLNPGVVISDDKQVHLKNLKSLPPVEEEVDKCIECGFCERMCPSRDVTLSPRKRIVLRRLMSDPFLPFGKSQALKADFQYQGLDTCAADGLCAVDCPVDINTGTLVKRLRSKGHSSLSRFFSLTIARHFYLAETCITFFLRAGAALNHFQNLHVLNRASWKIRSLFPHFPVWMNSLRVSRTSKKTTPTPGTQKVVLFSSCVQRIMGGNTEEKTWTETLCSLALKSNIQLVLDENKGLCCGQAFSSKGYEEAAALAANASVEWLWNMTEEGKHPVLIDTSSCVQSLYHTKLSQENERRLKKLQVLDVTAFCSDYVLPSLSIPKKKEQVALHPVCSLEKMKLKDKLLAVANACAEKVLLPHHAGCCGMAGDKGFFFPELTAAATSLEAQEIQHTACSGYYSTGRTCEMAMSEHTGKEYLSLIYLLDEVGEPKA